MVVDTVINPQYCRLHKIVHDLCALAVDVYKAGPADASLGYWQRLQESSLTKDEYSKGFFARLYGHAYFKETVVAYRGTSIFRWGDIDADFKLKFHKSSAYDHDAIVYYDQAHHYLMTESHGNYIKLPMLTGHSLGGYLAQVVAIKNADKKPLSVAFNAPGPGGAYIDDIGYIDPSIHYDHIYNYALWQDKVHRVGAQVGHLQEVRNPHHDCFNKALKAGPAFRAAYEICQHSIDTMSKEIDIFPEINS
jgi:hypothetical protein